MTQGIESAASILSMPVMPAMATSAYAQGVGGAKVDAAVKAARDFESVLLHKVMEEMQRTVDESGLLQSEATEQTQSIFCMYMAQEIASKGGLGLWKQVYAQMNPQASAPATMEQLR